MRTLLIHISDIHIDTVGENHVLKRASQIISAAAGITRDLDGIVVLISGDIAFSGQVDEYKLAEIFIAEIREVARTQFSNIELQIVIIPGNHDCNFSVDNQARKVLLQSLREEIFDESVYEILSSVQDNYFQFIDRVSPSCSPNSITERVYKEVHIAIDKTPIVFRLLNSSLLSSLEEQQGKLLFPNLVFDDKTNADSEAIVISVIHHPYNWFEQSNARRLKDTLESTSDFILTGHEHYGARFLKTSRQNNAQLEYLEGKLLQGDGDPRISGFYVVLLDTKQGLYKAYDFNWNQEENLYKVIDAPNSLPIQRNLHRLRRLFLIQEKFANELNDTGAQFFHQHKDKLVLDDIYIFPDFQLIDTHSEVQTLTLIKEQPPEFVRNNKRVLFLGKKSCGKTALSRILFYDLYRNGIIPVIVRGEEIRKVERDYLFELIISKIKRQFEGNKEEDYKQLPPTEKAIIIDDYDQAGGNSEARREIIKLLEKEFEVIILLADEELRFADFLDNELETLATWNYSCCQMMELGHSKRSQLIRKWLILGREFEIDPVELQWHERHYARTVEQLLGINLIPSIPLFVLYILQQLEAANPIRISLETGSHGHVYESMLTISLGKSAQGSGLDLDTLLNYMTELTYFMYQKGIKNINLRELEEWHADYCESYSIRLNLPNLLKIFEQALFIINDNNVIMFRYSYINYYFVARYLSLHINKETIRSQIVYLSQRLHHSESANIILFVSYLSKDELIINSVMDAAKKLFEKYDRFDLEVDSAFLKTMDVEIPTFFLDPSIDPQQRRDEIHKLRDERSLTKKEKELPIDEHVPDEEIEEYLKVNLAYKTIQILGQILRNYAGSLPRERKIAIAQETFALGLRILKFMFFALETSKQEFVAILTDFLLDKDPEFDRNLLSGAVGNLIFRIAEGLSFIVVKHLSNSVGLEMLSPTFLDLKQHFNTKSYDVIHLSIQLDHYKAFPEDEIIKLFKDLRKSMLGSHLVKHLTWYHMYLYSIPDKVMQRISSHLDIDIIPKLRIPSSKRMLTPRSSASKE